MEEKKVKEAPIIYTLQETAEILRLSERTIYTYIYENKLKAQKAGHSWRITREAIQDFLNGNNG